MDPPRPLVTPQPRQPARRDGLNYVGNNPINYTDPTGLLFDDCEDALALLYIAFVDTAVGLVAATTVVGVLLLTAGVYGLVAGIEQAYTACPGTPEVPNA